MRGRHHKPVDPDAVRYWRSKGWTYQAVCSVLGVSYTTLRAHGLLDGRTAASYRPGYNQAQIMEEVR